MDVPMMRVSLQFPLRALSIISMLFILFSSENTANGLLGNETDKHALVTFKSDIIEDPQGVLASWNDTFPFCRWIGVKCNKRQRVISLDLKGKGLAGTVTAHIGNLSELRFLDLSENSFHGEIPPGMGRLISLESLNMSNNFLGGYIPLNVTHCWNLVSLELAQNSLTGQIPPEIGSLQKLVNLHVGNNNLTGSFPASLGNLTSLQKLDLSYNNLKGIVPDSVSQLKNMTWFRISVNNFSGEFPSPLYNMTSLTLISLAFNNFTGSLSPNVGYAFPFLQFVWMAYNSFTGSIPDSISNASYLQQLDLIKNRFIGTVPMSLGNLQKLQTLNVGSNQLGSGQEGDLTFLTSLTNCSSLQSLHLGFNQFGGILPNSIANLSTQMTKLYLLQNTIAGSIPKEIANLVNLDTLYLAWNNLTGQIPDSIGRLPNLQALFLFSNKLTGGIPTSFGNLTRLLYLFLFDNKLEGSVPLSLRNCKQMLFLSISQNNLSGMVSNELVTSISSILSINVSFNSLTGILPVGFGNLSHLAEIDFSYNNFSGEIPSSIGKSVALQMLLLQQNSLQGTIPYLGDLENLQYMDLSRNRLSGQIPSFMVKLQSLVFLNLSFNNLEGEVPMKGIFSNASAIEVLGNSMLCGGIQQLNLPNCSVQEPQKSHGKPAIALKVILVTVSVFIFLSLFVFSFCWIKKSKKQSNIASTSGHFFPKISYEELLNASDGFSARNLVGTGSFGSVYKGILQPSDKTVAIKVLNLQRREASKSFIAECQALRYIRHRNLVKVITACSSVDFNGNEFKALVYDFIPNGSLDEWLHQEERKQQSSLDLLQRINIAIDVASALSYLHHQCPTPVVHCHLKPQNILLDNDFTACVGDFGLARMLSRFNTEFTNVNQFSSLGIKGTIGYAAPEYGIGVPVSILGDVYSYGILLLEIFTGRRPTDTIFQDNMNIHHFVRMGLPDRVMDILDRSALYKGELGISSTWNDGQNFECLVSILQIGVVCTQETPQKRMAMREVYNEMIMIRDKFLGEVQNQECTDLIESRSIGFDEAV